MATYSLKFLTGAKAKYDALAAKDNFTFYLVNNADNTQDLYLGGHKLTNAADLAAAVTRITTNEGDISNIKTTLTKLENTVDVEGSIRNLAKAAVDALDAQLAAVAKSGAAADVTVADAGGNFTSATKNVETVLAEIAGKISSASSDATVTVAKTVGGENDNFVAKYVFSQGGTPIENAEITIAKDMVATNGELVHPTVENPITIDGQSVTDGAYIKMTIGNGSDFYIDVADLIEYNSVASTAEITLSDANHQITATVGEIAASKIIYKTEVVEGETVKTTVAQAIAALESASSAGVDDKIAAAIADLDATASQTAGADGLAIEITEVDGKLTGVTASIAAETYDAHGSAAAAETAARGYTDTKIGALNATVTQEAGADGLALQVVESNGVLSSITGSIAANTYDAYGSAATAKSEVIGANTDLASANTIYGAKAYADNAAQTAATAAMTWTDME